MADARTSIQRIGRRYIIEEKLGQGGMGVVYRAYDRLTSQHVALKHVTIQKENLEFATRVTGLNVEVALAQEFKTLASLRHPHIISVLDYGFDDNLQPYFTMELLEDAQDIIEAGALLPQEEQIRLLVQVLQALAYLHRRGIIHRDLKPDNVMVIAGQVKVLDFGLAVAQEYLGDSADVVAGTLAYMAPEVLQGQSASMASDLYAVGMMAYELFAEKYPFEFQDVAKLMNDIIYTPPDMEALALEPVLENAVIRLLAKDPSARFSDARELIRMYAEATNQELKYETDTIRESFLQAARFVGRDEEMSRLTGALREAQKGQASTWLVRGESGVGKSRLLEELRTQALVQGMLAVRGGAVSNGGTPYQLWREPLRRLSLEVDLDDSEAAILKSIVSDLSRLVERDVPDAAELDPQAAQDRLIATVESTLRRLTAPVVLFLEDLQWAGSESLVLLDRLGKVADMPMLIVGSYRDDEQSEVALSLPAVQQLKLERLQRENIETLSQSILGDAGRRREVVDLLQRETEGNIFFIIEVVRALAEEAGQLELVGATSLPDSIFAGGVQTVIQRRLQRVPREALPRLQYAAIIGRQIDLELLQHLDPTVDNTTWLTICGDAAVLEVQDDHWRFSHDKFREALLRDLVPDQQIEFHHQVAEAIEVVYQGDLASYYPVLAHHWTQAKVTAKALEYLEKAAEQALETFANQEALEYLSRAHALADETGTTITPLRRARWQRQIGQAYWGLGHLAALRQHTEDALRLHNRPIPGSSSQLGLALLKQTGIQLVHRARRPARISSGQEIVLEVVRAYKLLGQVYFFMNEANLTVYVTLQQLNLAERIAESPELAEAYVNMCLVAGLVPMHSLARTYERLGIAIAELLDDRHIIGQASSVVSLYYLGLGQWDAARRYIQRSTTIAEQTGDRRLWESVSGVRALVYGYQGLFEEARDVFTAVYESSQRSGNTQTLLWGMLGQAENLLPGGRFEEAHRFLEEAQAIPIAQFGRDSEIRAHALVALVNFRLGKTGEALRAAEIVFGLITQAAPTASYLLQHYAAIAEIYFAFWEQDQPSHSPQDFHQRAQRTCQVLGRFARIFPLGRPREGLFRGRLQHLDGKPDRAARIWEHSLAEARRLTMPYDEALIHREIGCHAALDDPERPNHLKLALGIFEELTADYDADLVKKLLASPNS